MAPRSARRAAADNSPLRLPRGWCVLGRALAGQRSAYHRWIAAASRWVARGTGCWRLPLPVQPTDMLPVRAPAVGAPDHVRDPRRRPDPEALRLSPPQEPPRQLPPPPPPPFTSPPPPPPSL